MAIRRPLDTNVVDITGADLASNIAISTTGNIATTGSGTLTVAGNSTLSGTNNLGSNPTVTLGSNTTFPTKVTDHTYFYYLMELGQYMSGYGAYLATENVEGGSQRIVGIAPTNFTSVQDIKCWFICVQTPPNSGASPYTPSLSLQWGIGSNGNSYAQHSLSNTVVSGYSTDLAYRLNAVSMNNVGSSGSRFEDLIASGDSFGMEVSFGGAFERRALGISITWRF